MHIVNERVESHTGGEVGIIVLNWNGHEDTRECLESLRRCPEYESVQVVVVDNCSTKPGVEELQRMFADVTFLRLDTNRGFAAGNNVGIRYLLGRGCRYIILLNNDTIVSSECLKSIIEALSGDERAGAATGRILRYGRPKTEAAWYAGGHISVIRAEGRCETHEREQCEDKSENRYVSYATGCYLCLRRDILLEAGLLDEEFYFGVEDLEYSWRLGKYGYKILYVPRSVIWHKVGASRQGTPYEMYRGYISRLLYVKKVFSRGAYYGWLACFSLHLLLVVSIRIVMGRGVKRGVKRRSYYVAVCGVLKNGWLRRLDTRALSPYDTE